MKLSAVGHDVAVLGADVIDSDGMRVCDDLVQRGRTSVRAHCVSVAKCCLAISRALPLGDAVDERSLVRGALLHDYFLYDRHDRATSRLRHATMHPRYALENADRDFELNDIERDMIRNHMFPLTPTLPTTIEGRLLCVVDKAVGLRETLTAKRDGLQHRKRDSSVSLA